MANEFDPAASSDNAYSALLPVVADRNPTNWGMWAFFAILPLGGLWLFSALSANRAELQAPSTFAPSSSSGPGSGAGRITAGPPLAIPQLYAPRLQARNLAGFAQAALPQEREAARPSLLPRDVPGFARPTTNRGFDPEQSLPAPPLSPVPSVVFERSFSAGNATAIADAEVANDGSRVTASRFANPSRTIPQGTVIPAVLETALDSTRPGSARALVQRDVYSFDGTRVLVQRGSRLFGTYEAGLEAGQNRALIQWTRLIRPDGVTIALDSPSSDPLGRAGVKGRVDGKFLQRFGGAILQSVLDVGVGVATRKASDGVILALPGSTQNVGLGDRENVQRTLKIRHGTSVSVFVARDLDFSTVE